MFVLTKDKTGIGHLAYRKEGVNMEMWKDIPGYECLYEISTFGNVFSKRKKILLKPHDNGYGYLMVCLVKNGESKWVRIHQLVLLAFEGEMLEGYEVNHIDGNKYNNHLDNLEYVTSSENQQHKVKALGYSRKGMPHCRPVRCIETGREYDSISAAARDIGCSETTIRRNCYGYSKTAAGFHWEFVQ